MGTHLSASSSCLMRLRTSPRHEHKANSRDECRMDILTSVTAWEIVTRGGQFNVISLKSGIVGVILGSNPGVSAPSQRICRTLRRFFFRFATGRFSQCGHVYCESIKSDLRPMNFWPSILSGPPTPANVAAESLTYDASEMAAKRGCCPMFLTGVFDEKSMLRD